MTYSCSFETPVGPLTVLADRTDNNTDNNKSEMAVVAAGFCSAQELWDRLPSDERSPLEAVAELGPLQQPILDYLDGDMAATERLPLRQSGTELQQAVWQQLQAIPAGQTRTYGQLAAGTGKPKAVRAVGSACGRNLIAPFVPCHRALRSDGSLGGYYYGLDVKRWLLAHESQKQPTSA